MASCAVCHDITGKGDGAYAGPLEKRVPDTTLLAKANGSVFPFQRVYEAIDGTREMPIWGQDSVVSGLFDVSRPQSQH